MQDNEVMRAAPIPLVELNGDTEVLWRFDVTDSCWNNGELMLPTYSMQLTNCDGVLISEIFSNHCLYFYVLQTGCSLLSDVYEL